MFPIVKESAKGILKFIYNIGSSVGSNFIKLATPFASLESAHKFYVVNFIGKDIQYQRTSLVSTQYLKVIFLNLHHSYISQTRRPSMQLMIASLKCLAIAFHVC